MRFAIRQHFLWELGLGYYWVYKEKDMSETSVSNTLEERGSRYGSFVGHANVTQSLKNITWLALQERNKVLPADMLEALDMIYHKIGRIINGDPNYADSWHDIAGYASLVDKRLNGETI